MSVVALLARLILAGVFAVSGVAKLADRAGSRQAVRDFGVPGWLASPLAFVLPIIELIIAVALLPASWAGWAGAAAAVLLGIFSIAIAVNLIRGRNPDCHCFGQLSLWQEARCSSRKPSTIQTVFACEARLQGLPGQWPAREPALLCPVA